MALFVIGDLHLSLGSDKPMDIFGEAWLNHHLKIKTDWEAKVAADDTVIVPGDVSWAMTFEEAKIDLEWLDALPGKKIVFKGNHDFWWVSKKKMTGVFKTITFVHNDFAVYEDRAICGTRGWLCPNAVKFDENDARIYQREVLRLENSILMARQSGYEKVYGVLHYPPTNDRKEASLFTACFEKYDVSQVVYGHIHAKANFKYGLIGAFNGVTYQLTSCDFLDFKLWQWR